jgi:hypothetical protein
MFAARSIAPALKRCRIVVFDSFARQERPARALATRLLELNLIEQMSPRSSSGRIRAKTNGVEDAATSSCHRAEEFDMALQTLDKASISVKSSRQSGDAATLVGKNA